MPNILSKQTIGAKYFALVGGKEGLVGYEGKQCELDGIFVHLGHLLYSLRILVRIFTVVECL